LTGRDHHSAANKTLIHRQTPEEQELERKQIELAALESEIAQRELDLATFQTELRCFELRYLRVVGTKYAELDQIEAEIAETLARLYPHDDFARQRAERAREQAKESDQATGTAKADKSPQFQPGENLKKLYRDAAKRIHPDLATDENERARRNKVMADLNRAYANGDEARLQAILDEWEGGPEAVKGEDIAAELVRIIRKIAQVRERLAAISREIAKLEESDLFKLRNKVKEAERQGRHLLEEMAQKVEVEISKARERLLNLQRSNIKA
jgi:hypothetical protein